MIRTAKVVIPIIMISVLTMTGCTQVLKPVQSPKAPSESIEKSVFIDDVKITLTTIKAEFSPSEIIPLRLRLTNTSDKAVALTFPSTQKYDFSILDKDGNEVWRWARGKSFAQTLTVLTINPGERHDFFAKVEVDTLQEGNYEATGTSTANELMGETLRIDIKIKK